MCKNEQCKLSTVTINFIYAAKAFLNVKCTSINGFSFKGFVFRFKTQPQVLTT